MKKAKGFPKQKPYVRGMHAEQKISVARGLGPRHAENSKEGETISTDTVPAMLTPHEAVLNVNAAELAGRGNIEQLNRKGNKLAAKGVDLAAGGDVDVSRGERDDLLKEAEDAFYGGGQAPRPSPTPTPTPAPKRKEGTSNMKRKQYQSGTQNASRLGPRTPQPPGGSPGPSPIPAFQEPPGGYPGPNQAIPPLPPGPYPQPDPALYARIPPFAQPGPTPAGPGSRTQQPPGGYPGPAPAPGFSPPPQYLPPPAPAPPFGPGQYDGRAGIAPPVEPRPLPGPLSRPQPPARPASFYPAGYQGGAPDVQSIGQPQQGYPWQMVNLSAPQLNALKKEMEKQGLNKEQIAGLTQAVQGFGQGYGAATGGGGAYDQLGGQYANFSISGGGNQYGTSNVGGYQGGISDIGYPPFVAPSAEYHADKGSTWVGPFDQSYMIPRY